jgi:hypothetical protein
MTDLAKECTYKDVHSNEMWEIFHGLGMVVGSALTPPYLGNIVLLLLRSQVHSMTDKLLKAHLRRKCQRLSLPRAKDGTLTMIHQRVGLLYVF